MTVAGSICCRVAALAAVCGFSLWQVTAFGSPGTTEALAPVVVPATIPARGVDLTPGLETLADPGGLLTLSDILGRDAGSGATPSGHVFAKSGVSQGFVHGALWARVSIENASEFTRDLLLVIEQPRIDVIDIFLVRRAPQGGATSAAPEHQTLGDSLPFGQRTYLHRFLNTRLQLRPKETVDIYLRAVSTTSIQLPLRVHTEASLLASTHGEQLGVGLYFGILLALFLYNLAVLVSIRDRSYLFYVCYVGAFGVFVLNFSGLGYQYVWPTMPALQNALLPLSLAAIFIAGIEFARTFMDFDRTAPLFARLVKYSIWPGVLLGAASVFPGLQLYATIALNIAIVLGSVVVTFGAIGSARHGYPPAYYFLFARAVLIASGIALPLYSFGLVPYNILSEYGVQIGSAAEMILLAFSLPYRINLLRLGKLAAEREAREMLEKRVDERTIELAEVAGKLRAANALLAETSIRDSLTGCYNRRYLDHILPSLIEAGARTGEPVSLCMLDIDRFKEVNDRHGHAAGDDCLRETAARIEWVLSACAPPRPSGSRATDTGNVVARFGGEEFCLIVANAAGDIGRHCAEAVRAAMEAQPFDIKSGAIMLTASIGVACYVPGKPMSPARLIELADQALYEAKRSGRNRVVMAEP